MAFDQPLTAAEEFAVGIQLHALNVETSKTAFAETVVGPLRQAAELIADEKITLGDTKEETEAILRDEGIGYEKSIAARLHIIAEGDEPPIHL